MLVNERNIYIGLRERRFLKRKYFFKILADHLLFCVKCLVIPKQSLLLGHTTVDHCTRYIEMRASSDPYFPLYGQNRIFPYLDRIGDTEILRKHVL